MSTTTEPVAARTALRFAAAAALVLVAWFAGLGVLARWAEPTREVLVLVEPGGAAALLSRAPVLAIDAPAGWLRVRGESPGFVAELYASGARLVLPAAGSGCRTPPPGRSRGGA